MKRTFRQLLALFLCLVFVFSILPVAAATVDDGQEPEETQTESDLTPTDGETGGDETGNGEVGDDETGDGETGDGETDDALVSEQSDPVLSEGEASGGVLPSSGWYAPVTIAGTDYEIEFIIGLEEDGETVYIPFEPLSERYTPFDSDDISASLLFKVVLPDEDARLIAAPELQALLTDLTVGISGTNEDGTALSSSRISWNDSTASGSMRLLSGSGFTATLTADFHFDGQSCSVSTSISYAKAAAYLGFEKDGSEMGSLPLSPGGSLSGRLILHRWDGTQSAYTASTLTSADADKLSFDASLIALSWGEGNTVTISALQSGNGFSICYNDADTGEQGAVIPGYFVSDPGGGGPTPPDQVDDHVDVTYNGGTVSIYPGFVNGDDLSGTVMVIDDFLPAVETRVFDHTFLLQGFTGYPWSGTPVGSADFYSKISDVSVTLANGTEGLTLSPVTSRTFFGKTRDAFTVTSTENLCFEDCLLISFRYEGETCWVSAGIAMQEAHLKTFEMNGQRYAVGLCDAADESFTPAQSFTDEEHTAVLTLYTVGAEGALTRVTDETTLALLTVENAEYQVWNGAGTINSQNGREMQWTATGPISGSLWVSFSFDGYHDSVRAKMAWREDELPNGGGGGENGGGNGEDGNWQAAVVVDQTEYKIGFLMDGGMGYWSYSNGGCSYDDYHDDEFTWVLNFGAATECSAELGADRILAGDDIQAMIENLTVSFDGRNEDGTDNPKWVFSWDSVERIAFFNAPHGAGFSGKLTAEFDFGEEHFTVQADVHYDREMFVLGFQPADSAAEQFSLNIIPQQSVSGTLILNRWDPQNRRYEPTPLTADDLSMFVRLFLGNPDMQLAFDYDDSGVVTLSHTGPAEGNFQLIYELEDPQNDIWISAALNGSVGDSVFDTGIVALQCGDDIIHTGVGFLQSGSLRLGDSYGDSYQRGENKPFYWEYVLGGLKNYQIQETEIHAAPDFFDRIVSCSVEMTLLSGTMPTLTDPVKVAYQDLDGAELYTFRLTSAPDTPFRVTMTVTFQYKENGWQEGDDLAVYTAKANVFYDETTDVSVDASDLDSVEALNAVLASKDALRDYLSSRNVSFSWEGTLLLNLPAADYSGGVVVCDVGERGDYGVALVGSDSGTVFHGLQVISGLNHISNIQFTADPNIKQSYGSESPFTCGVLVIGTAEESASSIYAIYECSFSGFDYAARGTTGGYQGSVFGCTISDCDYGVYIDCDFNAAGNTENCDNTYIRCGDAILINKLPRTITAYMYRIHDNTFIDCGRDINITDAGTFLCYGNYFGLDQDTRRTARLLSGQYTKIVANPCRRRSRFGTNSLYWIDPALPTEILNSSADSLVIDSEAFTGEQINIDVVSMGQNGLDIVGTWSFGGDGT